MKHTQSGVKYCTHCRERVAAELIITELQYQAHSVELPTATPMKVKSFTLPTQSYVYTQYTQHHTANYTALSTYCDITGHQLTQGICSKPRPTLCLCFPPAQFCSQLSHTDLLLGEHPTSGWPQNQTGTCVINMTHLL